MPVLVVAGGGTVVAAAEAAGGSNSILFVVIPAAATVMVGLLALAGVIWSSRRRSNGNTDDGDLTISARVAVLEANQATGQADMAEVRKDVATILEHVRPWPGNRKT